MQCAYFARLIYIRINKVSYEHLIFIYSSTMAKKAKAKNVPSSFSFELRWNIVSKILLSCSITLRHVQNGSALPQKATREKKFDLQSRDDDSRATENDDDDECSWKWPWFTFILFAIRIHKQQKQYIRLFSYHGYYEIYIVYCLLF